MARRLDNDHVVRLGKGRGCRSVAPPRLVGLAEHSLQRGVDSVGCVEVHHLLPVPQLILSEPLVVVGSLTAKRTSELGRVGCVGGPRLGRTVVPFEFFCTTWTFAPKEMI